jgi:hypothetical protein
MPPESAQIRRVANKRSPLWNDRSTSFERLLKHTEIAFDGWAAAPESCNQLTSDFPRTDSSEYIGMLAQRVTYGRSDCSVRVKQVHKDVPLVKEVLSIRGQPAISISLGGSDQLTVTTETILRNTVSLKRLSSLALSSYIKPKSWK